MCSGRCAAGAGLPTLQAAAMNARDSQWQSPCAHGTDLQVMGALQDNPRVSVHWRTSIGSDVHVLPHAERKAWPRS